MDVAGDGGVGFIEMPGHGEFALTDIIKIAQEEVGNRLSLVHFSSCYVLNQFNDSPAIPISGYTKKIDYTETGNILFPSTLWNAHLT